MLLAMTLRMGTCFFLAASWVACSSSKPPGSDVGSNDSGPNASADAGPPSSDGAAVAPSAGCNLAAPASGERTLTLEGTERSYLLHVPAGYDPARPWPVVLNFHGRTAASIGKASTLHAGLSQMNDKADSAGFVVLTPQGLREPDGAQTWNAGQCCAADRTRDDVGFVDAMLDQASAALCIDAKRIYAAGLSNGGFLASRLACERADRIAAVAPVAAGNVFLACNPSRAISVMSFHGTADGVVPYAPAVQTTMDWVERNGCQAVPTETFRNGDSHCDTYAACAGGAEVVQCTVDEGGHTWPGGVDLASFGFGKTTQDLSANDAMWEFFQRHPLP